MALVDLEILSSAEFTLFKPKVDEISLLTINTILNPSYGKYTTNGTYQTNLNTLLSSLSSNGPTTGFFTATQGNAPDQINGLVLCRGDTDVTACASCLDNAVPDIAQLCPYQKSAIIWYDDCLLRYSNLRFFNSSDGSHAFYMWNVKNVSNPTPFFKTLKGLMGSLVNRAVNDTSAEMFATGDVEVNGAQRLYGLVQCTRDLSRDMCADCLRYAIGEIPTCCAGKIGGRVVGASCNIRYEVYRFYRNSSIWTAFGGSPPPLPPPPTTTMITQKIGEIRNLGVGGGSGGFSMRIIGKSILGRISLDNSIAINGTYLTVSDRPRRAEEE
ncbi:Cysteine-rich repeat secretory protein 38 [Acorus gramineus]|uniref:Cysteine-rich repeat secretory protein 38 n=1 Tax=Acorus gramineus TaxID=55184 RepID=A0AAV9BU34_ACOGR|nr:Cysteine-rich repeat secretory protein 38 [Acorus gramineus]